MAHIKFEVEEDNINGIIDFLRIFHARQYEAQSERDLKESIQKALAEELTYVLTRSSPASINLERETVNLPGIRTVSAEFLICIPSDRPFFQIECSEELARVFEDGVVSCALRCTPRRSRRQSLSPEDN